MSTKKYEGKDRHTGPDRSSPYPVSRLAPALELVDLAKEIAQADEMLNTKASAKLKVIADQVKALQSEAVSVLEEAKRDRDLHAPNVSSSAAPA